MVEFFRWLGGYCRLPEAPGVLDIGCGPGRMLAPLQEQLGWRVFGVEPDPVYRKSAQEHATVYEGDFEHLPQTMPWDLVFAINGPLLYLKTPSMVQRALQSCFAALRPGGWLLLENPNFLYLLKNYEAPGWHNTQLKTPRPLELRRKASHSFDFYRALWLHGERVEWRESEAEPWQGYDEEYSFLMLSPQDLIERLQAAGFVGIISLTGWAARAPSQEGGRRIVLAAQKPSEPPR